MTGANSGSPDPSAGEAGADVGTPEMLYVTPCTDCAYLSPTGEGRTFRGGRVGLGDQYLRSSDPEIQAIGPAAALVFIGIRCARAP